MPVAGIAAVLCKRAVGLAYRLLVQLMRTAVSKSDETQNLKSRAECALNKDPHLRSSPFQGEGKKEVRIRGEMS